MLDTLSAEYTQQAFTDSSSSFRLIVRSPTFLEVLVQDAGSRFNIA